jgi:dipeptidyl aminopeptidase/acylaminoacyl peptidase
VVPVAAAYKYYEALKGRAVETRLKVIDGADHTFNSVPWEKEVLGLVSDWFIKTL